MSLDLKTTALHGWHVEKGATMADFGGYEMPLWYDSAKAEHLSVLTHAGLFDTSHMAVILLSGSQSYSLLQNTFTKDLDACIGKNRGPLVPGRSTYGAFLNAHGETIDDGIINQLAKDDYMVVVNAGMGAVIAGHLQDQLYEGVEVVDLTDRFGKIDIQGPHSAKILWKVLALPEVAFAELPYFSFKGHFLSDTARAKEITLKDGTPLMLSRTGYTGEFGFELFVPPEATEKVWQLLLDAGEDLGITPCGLAARDSLRGGAVLPLSHQDIGHWPFVRHPWPFALPYDASCDNFTKDFLGADALLAAEDAPYTYAFVGKDARKVDTEEAVVLSSMDQEIGTVLTCVTDMAIGLVDGDIVSIASPDRPEGFAPRGLCCGFLKTDEALEIGTDLILLQGKRRLPVRVVTDVRPHRTARKAIKQMI